MDTPTDRQLVPPKEAVYPKCRYCGVSLTPQTGRCSNDLCIACHDEVCVVRPRYSH
jgi:hypothetical protein